MFGFRKKKTASEETQIPYQVYESVYEPTNRRRKLIVRLVIALVVVTLLIFGILAARRLFNNGTDSATPAGAPDTKLQQAPQGNSPLPRAEGAPAQLPISTGTNDRTIDQPQ
jgi:Mg2+/citrate symporter